MFTEKAYKIASIMNDDKFILSNNCKESFAYGTCEKIVHKTEEMKYRKLRWHDTRKHKTA